MGRHEVDVVYHLSGGASMSIESLSGTGGTEDARRCFLKDRTRDKGDSKNMVEEMKNARVEGPGRWWTIEIPLIQKTGEETKNLLQVPQRPTDLSSSGSAVISGPGSTKFQDTFF